MAATLLGRFKQQIDSLELIPSSGGRFELLLDGQLEYSKLKTGAFPDEAAMLSLVDRKFRSQVN